MLKVIPTGSHSHVGSQTLGEVRHRLVDMFLWQLFPDHQSSQALVDVYGTFSAWHP